MEHSEDVILTNMCMVYDGTKVLVEEKRLKDGEGRSRGITFPGGHVEDHEPIVDSVIREIYEETGLTIENPRLCGIKDWVREDGRRYIVFLFKTDRFSGELKSRSSEQSWRICRTCPSYGTWTACCGYSIRRNSRSCSWRWSTTGGRY